MAVVSRKGSESGTTRLLTAGQNTRLGLVLRLVVASVLFAGAFLIAPELDFHPIAIGCSAFVIGYVVRPIHHRTAYRKRDRAFLQAVEYVNFLLIAVVAVAAWLILHRIGWQLVGPALRSLTVRILATVFFIGVAVRDMLMVWRGV